MGIGSQAVVGGILWGKVNLPGGVTGDFGGTVAAGNAFIVTAGGVGIAVTVVPEPGKFALVSLGFSVFLIRRHRPTAGKVS